MANIYSVLSDETLDKIAAGGDLYESMTDEELDKVIQIEKEEAQASSYNNQGSSDDYSQLWESYKGAFPEPNWGDSIEQDNPPDEVIGKTAPLLTKEDAKAMPSMGASEIAALQVQQQGGPTAYEADGSISNWLGNLWNAISFNSSGKLTAKSTARHNQSILRGTVKKDGKEVPLTELDDDELDYLVDSAGWNGWTGWLGSFVGNRSDNGIMQQWDKTIGAKITDPIKRKAERVKYAQDIARQNIEQQEWEKHAATTELENRSEDFGAGLSAGFITTGSGMLPYLIPHAHDVVAGLIVGGDRAQELMLDRYFVDDDGTIRVAAERDSTGDALLKGAARGAIAPAIERFGGRFGGNIAGSAVKNTLGKIPLFKIIEGKVVKTTAGKAISKWMNSMNRLSKYTGLHSFPIEMVEEFEDQVLDAGLGLNLRESEKGDSTFLSRAGGAVKEFFKPENLADLAESMVILQVLGGGAAFLNDRKLGKHIDNLIVKEGGIAPEELKDYTLEEKLEAYNAFVNGLSEEEIAERFDKGAEAINKLSQAIKEGSAFIDDFEKSAIDSIGTPSVNTETTIEPRRYQQEDILTTKDIAEQGELLPSQAQPQVQTQEVMNETGHGTDEAPAQPEQEGDILPTEGEAARPVEEGETPAEVGGAIEATSNAPTSAPTETTTTTPSISAESTEGGSRISDEDSIKNRWKELKVSERPRPFDLRKSRANLAERLKNETDITTAKLEEELAQKKSTLETGRLSKRLGSRRELRAEVQALEEYLALPEEFDKLTMEAPKPPKLRTQAEADAAVVSETQSQMMGDELPVVEKEEILPSEDIANEPDEVANVDVLPTTDLPETEQEKLDNNLNSGKVDNETQTIYNASNNSEAREGVSNDTEQTQESDKESDNELRGLQEEGRTISPERRRLFSEGSVSLDVGERDRFARVLRRRVERKRGNDRSSTWVLINPKTKEKVSVDKVDGKTFYECFSTCHPFLVRGDQVELHSPEYYDNGFGIISSDGLAGFFITESGDAISGYSLQDSSGRGRGFFKTIAPIMKQYAKTADCFHTKKQDLPGFYKNIFGFQTAAILDFNYEIIAADKGTEYADWFVENYGEAPVYFMVNVPHEVTTKHFNKDQYEEAVAYQKEALEGTPKTNNLKNAQGVDSPSSEDKKSGRKRMSEVEKKEALIKRKTLKAKIIYDDLKSNNVKLTSSAFRYNKNNPRGLRLNELYEVAEFDDSAKEYLIEAGLTEEQADELIALVKNAEIAQKLAAPNRADKINEVGQETNAVKASQALTNFAHHPDDLKAIAKAFHAVSAAAETSSRTQDEADYWESKLQEIVALIITLPQESQDKVQYYVRQEDNNLDNTKNTTHITNSDGGNNESLAQVEANVNEINFEESQKIANEAFADKGDATQEAPGGGSMGEGGFTNRKGNRLFTIVKISEDGKTFTVKMQNVGKGDRGEQTVDVPKKALDALAKAEPMWAELAKNPVVGAQVLRSIKGETKAERDLRFSNDKDYQKWLKKQKANDAEPLRQRYEAEGLNAAASMVGNFLKGVKTKTVDRDYNPDTDGGEGNRNALNVDHKKVDGDERFLRDPKTGKVVGTWNRNTNELTLYRGANANTLIHELGGHAAYQFAQQQAEQGDTTLLRKMDEAIDYALNNPIFQDFIADVRSRYPDAGEDVLRDEIWAALMERNSPTMEAAIKTLQGKAWYNRAWQAIKDAFKAMLTHMGYNKADLRGIDKMKPEEFISWLDNTMAEGKSLGALEKEKGEGVRNAFINPMTLPNLYAEDSAKQFREFEQIAKRVDKLEEMESMGIDRDTIWQETGLWRGKDGEIRTEVPDIKVSDGFLKYMQLNANVEPTRQLKTVDAESGDNEWLFRLYPEFRTMPITITNIGGGTLGIYRGVKDGIWLDRSLLSDPEMFRAVLANELQHAIQLEEGFSTGTNLENMGGYDDYKRATGEVEARNVAARLALTPEGREAVPPWETEDVSEDEQIVDYEGGVSLSQTRRNDTPTDNNIRHNVSSQGDASNHFMDDVRSTKEKLEEKFVDSLAPVKGVVKEIDQIAKARGEEGIEEVVNEDGFTDFINSTDYIAAKDKENGHLERKLRELQQKYIDPAMKSLARAILPRQNKDDLVTDFNLYLQYKHAEARNRKVAEDRGDTYTPDYSEGMGVIRIDGRPPVGLSENVANELLAELERKYGSKMKFFEDAAQSVYNMLEADLVNRNESGLLSDEELQHYMDRRNGSMGWGTYVPLKTDLQKTEGEAYNAFNSGIKRNEFMKAKGRGSLDIADSPFAAAILQAEQGIRRSSRNVLANVEANIAALMNGGFQRNGLTDFSVTKRLGDNENAEPVYAEIVEGEDLSRGGTEFQFVFSNGDRAIASGGSRLVQNRSDIHLFKRDGKLYAIRYVQGANNRGLAVAKSFSGENMGYWGKGMEWLPKFANFLSAMRTQYSPEFMVSNMLSDNLDAFQALVGRYGIWDGSKAFAKAVKNQWKNGKDLAHYLKTGEARGKVKDAINAGLLTKGGVVSEGIESETVKIRGDISKFIRKQKQWRDMTKGDLVKSFGRNVMDFISMANEFAEYSTRIGISSALEEYGIPRKDAIKFARDATVNFNRKGTAMPYINSLYIFANASVQGAMRSLGAFKDDLSNTKVRSGELGANRKFKGELVGTLVLIGVAKAVVDSLIGDDDEREKQGTNNATNLTEYDRKHNVGIPIGGGRQVVPLRFRGPYAAIPYLAQTFTRVAMGEITPTRAAEIVASELGDQTTELIGGNGILNDKGEFDGSLFMQSIAPTLIDPFVQIGTGKDYKGDNRLRKRYDETVPLSSNAKRSTPMPYVKLAKIINLLTGGNENRSGRADFAPEDIQLITEFLGGAPWRDINNVISTGQNIAQVTEGGSPEKFLSQMPFVRRVVREYPENTGRYYDAIETYERDKAEYKRTTRLEDRRLLKKGKPYLSSEKNYLDKLIDQVNDLSHLENGEVKRGRKWVKAKVERSEKQKEAYRKRRLRLQSRILKTLEG